MSDTPTVGELIDHYIVLRGALAAKAMAMAATGMSDDDAALLNEVLAWTVSKGKQETFTRLLTRFEYLATGMGAYRDGMVAIEAAVTAEIVKANGQSFTSANKNTAYRQEWTSAKVDDREAFMDFVFDGRQEGFLTSHVSKDAVEEYMKQHNGQLPAGIKWDSGYKVNFRKATGT